MRKLFKTRPILDEKFYSEGVYSSPIHHSQNNRTSRLFLTAGLLDWLRMIDASIADVIDLGCGDGGLIRLLDGRGLRMTGYDLAAANINYAIENNTDDLSVFLHEDFTKKDSFKADVIIMTETIEHLLDPNAVLNTLYSKYLIISTPMNEDQHRHTEQHLWAWTEKEFLEMVTDHGYKPLQQIRVNNRTQLWVLER